MLFHTWCYVSFYVSPRTVWGSRNTGLRGKGRSISDDGVTEVRDKGFKVASVSSHTLLSSTPDSNDMERNSTQIAAGSTTLHQQPQQRQVVYLPLNLGLLHMLLERQQALTPFGDRNHNGPRSQYHGSRRLGGVKSRILFHHVWKCAGANICDMALRNGEAVPNNDPTNPSSRCELDSLNLQDLIAGNYSFASIQSPMPANVTTKTLPAEISLVTVLRNPLDQVLSHYKHAQEDYGLWSNFSAFIEYGLCVSAEIKKGGLKKCQAHLRMMSFKALDAFALFRDNQQLRWLLPTQATTALDPFAMGVGDRPTLNEDDLQAAKARLNLYDEILILEDFHKEDRFRMQRYGWTELNDYAGANLHEPLKIWRPANAEVDLKEHPGVLDRLREIQHWDLQLYHYGQELVHRRNQLRQSKQT